MIPLLRDLSRVFARYLALTLLLLTTVAWQAHAQPPAIPTHLTATATQTSITASWDAVPTASSYAFDLSASSDFKTGNVTINQFTLGTSRTTILLNSGIQYYFRLRAVGPGGISGYSATFAIPTTPPTPASVTATPIDADAARFSWAASRGANFYLLDLSPDPDFLTDNVYTDFEVFDQTSNVVVGLRSGTKYYFRMRAVGPGPFGTSPSSSTLSFTTAAAPPLLSVSPAEIPHALIFGGAYSVRVNNNLSLPWSLRPSSVPDWITISGVGPSGFTANVSSNLSSGPREASIVVQEPLTGNIATFHLRQEGPPVLTAAGVSGGMANLSWSVFPEAVKNINIYEVTVTPPVLLGSVDIILHTFDHTGLTPGSTHSYYVTAVGFDGVESGPSNTVTVTIPAGVGQASALAVYPNPVQRELVLSGPVATSGNYVLSVVDLYGQSHLKQQTYLQSGEPASPVDVSSLNPGLYILQVVDPSGKLVAKIRFEKESPK